MDRYQMTIGDKVEKVLYCLMLVVCSLEIAIGAQYSTVMNEWNKLTTTTIDDYYFKSDQAYYLFTGIYSILVLLFSLAHSFIRSKQPWSVLASFYTMLTVIFLQMGTAVFSIFTLVLEGETGFIANVEQMPESVQKTSFMTLEFQMNAQIFLVFLLGIPSFTFLMYHRHAEWTELCFKDKLSSEGQYGSGSSYQRVS